MTVSDNPEQEVKAALRQHFIQRRSSLSQNEAAQEAVRQNVLQCILESSAKTIALTWPLKGEVDLRPIFKSLLSAHKTILLPKIISSSRGLAFHQWTEHSHMRKGAFGTLYPAHSKHDQRGILPDMIVVPALIFDQAGYRIGYGKGCYDKALAANPRATLLGYCLEGPNQDLLPREEHDVPISRYCTPTGVFHV